uniref:Uncharacterized protein n=1 Tax=Arundo donax TaxID=35708 RepID=A0A0A9EDL2_ARUDO
MLLFLLMVLKVIGHLVFLERYDFSLSPIVNLYATVQGHHF